MTLKRLSLQRETLAAISGGVGGGPFTAGTCYTKDFFCTQKPTDILCTSQYTCVLASCEIKCIPQSTFCQNHL